MPNADDIFLMSIAPALAKPQVVEFRIKVATDGEWELDLNDLTPLLFTAAGSTIEEIRDGLADPIVSPGYDPFTVKKIVTDHFRVTGSKGDPFDYAFIPPDYPSTTSGISKEIQAASGATTEMRTIWLGLAIKLIKPDVWGDKTQEGQALLAAFFIEKALLAAAALGGLAVGGVASSMSLGGASVSLAGGVVAFPTDAELAGSIAYGSPLLMLWKSVTFGPIWSGGRRF